MNGEETRKQTGDGTTEQEPPVRTVQSDADSKSPSADPTSNQRQDPAKPLWKTPPFWQAVFSGFLVLNAALTIWFLTQQYEISRQNLSLVGKNIRLNQRAWLVTRYPTIQLLDGMSISVPLTIENIGNTLARRVSGVISVYISRAGEEPDLSYDPGHTHYTFGPTGYIIPKSPGTNQWIAIRDGRQTILTPHMHADIVAGRSVITMHGRIEYRDIFGNQHWMTFCQQTGGNGVSATDGCAAYNDTDDNN